MPPNLPVHPTAAELDILHLLWQHGPATVRALNERQNATDSAREIGYTTTLKLLQIMTDKGLVARDEAARQHVYRAAVAEAAAQKQLLTSSADELAQIRALLDELENPVSPDTAPAP
jgi:BlaI family transcriptional regulator, penicillinase repressor